MGGPPRAGRLVEGVLRCYPARWRRRHGEEAAELAALLIQDGAAAGSIAWNYLTGAAREWLTPRPGRRLRLAVCALAAVVCSLSIPAGLLASTGPAHAASTNPAPRHPLCRPGSPAPVRNASSLPAHRHPSTRETRHDRSC